jgi:hypothetical protein
VSKGHADAWVGFRIFQVRGRCGFSGTADVTEYSLVGCPGTKPCSSSSFLCTRSIHTTTTFCRILRLLLRALHRTINTIEETASVGGALCQQQSADSQIFTVPLEEPRVGELWQIVTVVYFVSFGEDEFCGGKKLQGRRQQIGEHMQGGRQRLHAVAPSTRGYNDSGSITRGPWRHGYAVGSGLVQLTSILSIFNLQIYQPSLRDLEVWLRRSKDQ